MGIAIAFSNTLFVANTANNQTQKYKIGNPSGTTIAGSLNSSSGKSPTELRFPTDIAVDSCGNVYVADAGNHRIMLWSVNATIGIQVAGTGGKVICSIM